MSLRLRDAMMNELGTLRYEPTTKRIRASLGGRTVIDTVRARFVWEPKRVVPTWAIPVDDIDATLQVAPQNAAATELPEHGGLALGDRRVLDPSIPFTVHTTDGTPWTLRTSGADRVVDAFRPADSEFDEYVMVDFDAFDAWYEEDERNVAHPRDPFHRIDILHSSRHVRVELDGVVLADSHAPYLLFEEPLPVRYYLPEQDVRTDLLEPGSADSWCAYKGHASYWSAAGAENVAWTYRDPLREAAEVVDRVAFFNERVDVVVDGQRLPRPITPWSPPD